MCGRSCLSLDKNQMQCACSYKRRGSQLFEKPIWLDEHNDGRDYVPSHNIAPTDITPVLISGCKYKNAVLRPHERVLKPMMWGIIPPWHKGDYRSHNMSTNNNCRLENIRSSKLYNPILKSGGRCIVVVEGFYEWQTASKSSKVKKPYYIYAVQREGIKIDEPITWNNEFSDCHGWNGITLLHMAGLYSIWQNDNTVIYSYSIITMEANNKMDWLHHRMPAILDTQEQVAAWLDIENVDPEMALGYLKPIKVLSWHAVSTLVNNSRNKSHECNKKSPEQTDNNKIKQKTLSGWIVKKKREQFSVDDVSPEPKKLKQ